ncbi:OmpH family outer membrane protein [Flavobacterium sp. MMLR14_040]|uniref:OmpH family outer membrane protein n=1 Tax=Flavobacterium sp. MMLR14_040 TaxID=3093843 RepID=UPI00298F4FA6|nr:OmpH family outer membrane protein [Flavobacterium sp. MMLR14_040]MDW8850103.1 OmpH family outer membrane protein [Flavobacterium sp. MMLR14_040]
MPKLSQKTNLIILLVCFILVTILFKLFNTNSKIVYVDSNRLFENFNMTKELKRLGEKEFNAKKTKTDFLYQKLQSPNFSLSEKEIITKEFIQSKSDLEQFNQIFASEQSSKIWARIKSYSSEFANENKYQLIIGSENKLNVLFADQNIDVTNDLLIYINKKYEGLK